MKYNLPDFRKVVATFQERIHPTLCNYRNGYLFQSSNGDSNEPVPVGFRLSDFFQTSCSTDSEMEIFNQEIRATILHYYCHSLLRNFTEYLTPDKPDGFHVDAFIQQFPLQHQSYIKVSFSIRSIFY